MMGEARRWKERSHKRMGEGRNFFYGFRWRSTNGRGSRRGRSEKFLSLSSHSLTLKKKRKKKRSQNSLGLTSHTHVCDGMEEEEGLNSRARFWSPLSLPPSLQPWLHSLHLPFLSHSLSHQFPSVVCVMLYSFCFPLPPSSSPSLKLYTVNSF